MVINLPTEELAKDSVMEKRVITLSGEVATGKSTIAKALLHKLGNWRLASTGERFRELTASRGWSIQKVSFLPDEVHKEVDLWQRTLAESESNIIIEGRLAGWVTRDLEYVFRVYCYSSLDVRIHRYMQRENCTEEKARADIEYRDNRDVIKYQNTYGIEDYRDSSFYNLLLDTSERSSDELAQKILFEANLLDR